MCCGSNGLRCEVLAGVFFGGHRLKHYSFKRQKGQAMDSQASWNETTDQGLEKSPEWQNVPKPHGEKCHDPARLDKIIDKWRESKGLATKPEEPFYRIL